MPIRSPSSRALASAAANSATRSSLPQLQVPNRESLFAYRHAQQRLRARAAAPRVQLRSQPRRPPFVRSMCPAMQSMTACRHQPPKSSPFIPMSTSRNARSPRPLVNKSSVISRASFRRVSRSRSTRWACFSGTSAYHLDEFLFCPRDDLVKLVRAVGQERDEHVGRLFQGVAAFAAHGFRQLACF